MLILITIEAVRWILHKFQSWSLESKRSLVGSINDKDAWYFGAGFDFSLDDNLWGLMDDTEVLAELGVNYTELATNQYNGLSSSSVAFSELLQVEPLHLPRCQYRISNCQYGDCIGFSKNKILEKQCI